MNARQTINLMPLLVSVVSLSFATYAIQTDSPTLASPPKAAAGTKSQPAASDSHPDATKPEEDLASMGKEIRDPFRGTTDAVRSRNDPRSSEADPYAGTISELSLNATFLQGQVQMAVINGKVYEIGQTVQQASDPAEPLVLAGVLEAGAILKSGPRTYRLAYSMPSSGPQPRGSKTRQTGRPPSAAPRPVRILVRPNMPVPRPNG